MAINSAPGPVRDWDVAVAFAELTLEFRTQCLATTGSGSPEGWL